MFSLFSEDLKQNRPSGGGVLSDTLACLGGHSWLPA